MLAPMIAEDRATVTIRRAEQDIRGQIAEAATAGEYEVVARLSGIAKRLAELAEEAGGRQVAAPRIASAVVAAQLGAGRGKSKPGGSPRTRRKETYPRFERVRDVLVKIGWSKKARAEYIHRTPKAGVEAAAKRVMQIGADRQVFTTEDLLPVKMDRSGNELPGYQAYICLAWFRRIGAVEQHGREGYTLVVPDLIGAVGTAWEALPASRR